MKVMLYGASGYTARLILQQAVPDGQVWVVAGRNTERIAGMATKMNMEYRVFPLNDVQEVVKQLKDIDVLLHLAGPFVYTAEVMMEACIRSDTHYLDITGELEVFELAASMNERAAERNIMLMPGCGFDVVATDALARFLSDRLPNADELLLAFASSGGMSRGTMRSALNKLGKPGAERINGVLQPRRFGRRSFAVQLGGKEFFMISIPWGDVVTAWYTTGVPNITAFMSISPGMKWLPFVLRILGPFLGMNWVKKSLLKRIDSMSDGPDEQALKRGYTMAYGRLQKGSQVLEAVYKGPQGYWFTALSCVNILKHIAASDWKPGFQTPAGCYGSIIAEELEGCIIKLR